MGLGAPWDDAYLEHQNKSSVVFINIETKKRNNLLWCLLKNH